MAKTKHIKENSTSSSPRKRSKADTPAHNSKTIAPPSTSEAKKAPPRSEKKASKAEKQQQPSSREKRLFDNLLKVTYEFIKGRYYKPQTKRALLDRLNIHEDHHSIFESVLRSLKDAGHVTVHEEKYHVVTNEPPSSRIIVRGQLSVHPRGFGFVNMPAPQDDIFIPKLYINGAVDGDTVDVEYDPTIESEKGPEGRVVAIIERSRKQLAGTVMSVVDDTAYIYSSLLGETNLCACPLFKKQKLSRGDRVIVDVRTWGPKKQPEECRIAQVIGNISDPLSDIPFAIHENGIRSEFPKQAVAEAKSFGTRVKPSDMKGRLDLRDIECFTIDPDTAKDFDDAISLEKIGTRYRLGVHIADVSHYVQPGSALDQEALLRCNSTYFPRKCIPMLPHELSDNLCSLKPNVNRLAVSVFMDIDHHGNTVGWDIYRSVIKSQKRFTYRQAKEVLDGKRPSKHKPTLDLLAELCKLLQKNRSERGSVQLSMPELVLKINDEGVPTGTEVHEYDITHQMIEECMLKANETVATHLARQGKDISYRVHEEPAKESLRDFSTLVQAFGFHLPETPTPHDIQRFFVEIEGSPHAQYLATSYIKSMRLACYSPENIGHYGLSLEHYCHFTSPIRRYVDTIIHRLLFGAPLAKDELAQICLRASERERISARAEGSVMQMKKLRYLSEIQKKTPRAQYKAVISRVKPYGIYFDVSNLMMDGFLHISELENDYFIFDDTRNTLVGRHQGIIYRAGDPITVMCKSIDLITAEATWHMVCRDSAIEDSADNSDSLPSWKERQKPLRKENSTKKNRKRNRSR